MDKTASIGRWRELLTNLDDAEARIGKNEFDNLAGLFDHLTSEVAIRNQKLFEACALKTEHLFEQVFDKIDLSDKEVLCSLLNMLESYGYFKLAQIIYFVDNPTFGYQHHPIHSPTIEKVKWYDLSPLLPKAGTIGWKSLMNHGLVKEEHSIMKACLQLLYQKLHFCAAVSLVDRYKEFSPIIKKNGERLTDKFTMLIRDEFIVKIDRPFYNLLKPFIKPEQHSLIIDNIINTIFKPYTLHEDIDDNSRIFIHESVINYPEAQGFLVTKLQQSLMCNIIRRKRRHSAELADNPNEKTLEDLLASVIRGVKLSELLPLTVDVKVTPKSLQTTYLSDWTKCLNRILTIKCLDAQNSVILLNSCSIILATTSDLLNEDLINDLSFLMAKTVECTSQDNLNNLFKAYDPPLLVKLTKLLSTKIESLSSLDTPMRNFFDVYLNRYLRCCLSRNAKVEAENFKRFVSSICDDTPNILQHICVEELSKCLDDVKGRGTSKVIDIYLECAKLCSEKLHEFIKKNLHVRNDSGNGSNGSHSKQSCVSYSLINILRIAIEHGDQETLDSYGDLVMKLFKLFLSRVKELIRILMTEKDKSEDPLDFQLSVLLALYVEHKDRINTYLNYDVVAEICSVIIDDTLTNSIQGSDEMIESNKKKLYIELKTKLEALEARAIKFTNIHQTIINKQYMSVTERSIGSSNDIKKERGCCSDHGCQLKTLSELIALTLDKCDDATYKKVLESSVEKLEACDALDHPKFLYLMMILESLLPRKSSNSNFSAFKNVLPRISYSLIRISKSVELGPSIRTFTRPGTHKSNLSVNCCTYSCCIRMYTQIFVMYPSKDINLYITDAMEMCISANLIQYANYSSRLQKLFIQLASAISGLLKSIPIGKDGEDKLEFSMPIFISVFSLLIRCIILASGVSNTDINGYNSGDEKDINTIADSTRYELLALDVSKIMNNLSSLRVRLVDYAPHLISSYIKDIQRAPCPDLVLVHLNEGIFRIFNTVDAHQRKRQEEIIESKSQRKMVAGRASGSLFDMIHARLDQASREIFKDMHDNYSRFYRYVGKC